MKKFDLELRVSSFGSIILSKIFLEDSTNDGNMVLDWEQGDGYRFKRLPDYEIADNALEVFVGCRGIIGGTVTCEVFINGTAQKKKVVSKVTDTKYAFVSYAI